MRSWSFICSVIAHVLLLLLIFGVSAWIKPQKQPEPLPLELELIEASTGPVTPPLEQNDIQPPETQEVEPEPTPEEKPPEPEQPKPDPPKPPEVKKPDPPKPLEVKKPDPPKPQEVKKPDPPKPLEPKQPSLQERINAARKTSRTVTPPPQPKADPAHQKALERTLSNFASTSSKGVRIPSASSVPGVPSSQMNNYQRYVARCVTPMLANLWQTLGPNALNGNVPPVVIDFFVAPNGSVQSCVVTIRSDNAQMNAAAEALIRELTRKGLPPFSTVGLSTERNAGLPLHYTLEYTR